MWRYTIAVVLLAHGIGHIMPFMAAWTPKISKVGFSDASWIFSGGIGVESPIGQAFALLGMVAHQTWWPTITVMAAAISIVTIVPWLNAWPTGNMIGALLVDVAVLVALLPPWEQQFVHAL